ncbi:MAG TPA: hypothetical protein VGM32_18610 [Rhodopila sp.]
MIRPLTVVTFLLACGSGLYLYQSKHEVQLLDRTIERTVRDTAALREQSRLLATEWNMLNDPERLRQFSDTYLNLKPIDPKQYASIADLDARLPPPRVEVPAPDAEDQPSAEATPQDAPPAPPVAEEKVLPLPPAPATRPASAARAAEPKVATSRPPETQSRPLPAVEARPVETRPLEQRAEQRSGPRVAETRAEPRAPSALPAPKPIILAAPRPQQPINTRGNTQVSPPRPAVPPAPPPGPAPGSLLGMARGPAPPAPRPIPVNASYSAN